MSAFADVKVGCPLSNSDTVTFDYVMKTTSATVASQRTFNPVGYVQPGVARWEDRSGGIQVGYPHFEMSVRPPVNGARINRVSLSLAMPTLEQTSASTASGIQPAPTKAYDLVFKGDWLLAERSARWERRALLEALISLLVTTITASDGAPSDSTGTPLQDAILDYARPY